MIWYRNIKYAGYIDVSDYFQNDDSKKELSVVRGWVKDILLGLLWCTLILLIFMFSLGKESRFIYTDF